MLLATALATYYRMYSAGRYCSKQTGSSSTKGNHPPSISSFLELGRKTVDAAKICGGAENVVKTETQQTFVNGLLGFITLGILYSAGSACVLLTIIMSCPSIWATLSALLINILLGSFQLFLQKWSASLGWNNPVQRCLPSGGRLHYPRRRREGAASRTDWQTLAMCNRRRPAATSSRRQRIIFRL